MGYDLSQLTTVNEEKGKLIIIHGVGGVGKSTLGVNACLKDDGIMILGEDGINEIGSNVTRTPVVKSWGEFLSILGALVMNENKFKTVVIDTMDAMTTLMEGEIVHEHYGDSVANDKFKARYPIMKEQMGRCLNALDMLNAKGIDVIVMVHSVVETVKNPDVDPYQSWSLNLPNGPKTSLATQLYDHASYCLFAKFDRSVVEGECVGQTRVLMTTWNSAYAAKSRKDLPEKMLLNWDALRTELNKKKEA